MKTLWICEKPSQAKDMSLGISDVFKTNEGYLEGTNNVISWAIGHLFDLFDAKDYDPEFIWSFDKLPFIPSKFEYKLSKDKKKQFNIIKNLIKRDDVNRIVEAGDAGREGELITRLILNASGNDKPVYRFWVTGALTKEIIQKGIEKLKPASEYDNLYNAALIRQHSDWIIGVNGTVAHTVRNGDLFTIGRIQTAVLSILAEREIEIINFKPSDYYTISLNFVHKNGEYTANLSQSKNDNEENNDIRFVSYEEADNLINKIINQDGIIKTFESKEKIVKPPLLFSLPELQKEANKHFGYSINKTTELVQNLYERYKVITYPRTDCCYLGTELIPEIPELLKKVNKYTNSEILSIDPTNKFILMILNLLTTTH